MANIVNEKVKMAACGHYSLLLFFDRYYVQKYVSKLTN